MDKNKEIKSTSEEIGISIDMENIGKPLPNNNIIQVKSLNSELYDNKYIAYLSDKNFSYTGMLEGKDLLRHGLGFNKYTNNDKYLGEWNNGVKHGRGIYYHNKENDDDDDHIYVGTFENNVRKGHGVYIWHVKDSKGSGKLEDTDFDAFIGNFDKDIYSDGVYISKVKDEFYCYFGNFVNGKKTDDKCFFYQANQDRLFFGKVKEDRFVSGHVLHFVVADTYQIGQCSHFVVKDDEPVITEKKLNDNSIKNLLQHCFSFVDSFVHEYTFNYVKENKDEDSTTTDCFSIVFKLYNVCKLKIQRKMDDVTNIENFDDEKARINHSFLSCSEEIVLNYYTDIMKFVEEADKDQQEQA